MTKKRIISGIVGMIVSLGILVSPVNAATLSEQLAESNQKQAAAQYQIDMTQNTIAGIEAEIGKANEEMSRITGVIDTINAEIAVLEANIARTQEELNIAEAKRKEQEESMNERVRTMYMYGNGSMLEFLFTSSDFADFVTKVDMSRYIIESDKSSLDALAETKRVIDEKKAKIEADRLQTVAKKTEQETALAQQQEIKAQKDSLIAQNQAIIAEYRAIKDAEEANAASIQAQIQEMMAAQAAASGGSTTGGSTSFVPSNGTYQWPCPGYYPIYDDDFFGTRLHPIWGDYRTHYGVDMAAPSGTPILAMGNGAVLSAGWNGGYGNCVIVDLGNGIQAMYAHMSGFAVSAGETVNKGDVVGYVGSTGDSTGAHLHFGVLSGGSYVDPLGYF